jgi:DNA-directed RNA polymerase specialized sigma24 family protein
VRAGDEDAMGVLYDRYSPLVYAVALQVLADTAAAEDVLQMAQPDAVRLASRQSWGVAGRDHAKSCDKLL